MATSPSLTDLATASFFAFSVASPARSILASGALMSSMSTYSLVSYSDMI
jgi:hypothetical protein